MSQDHYEVLGVDKEADKDTIQKAYRDKAMKTHPDVGGDKDEFACTALAYRILSDKDRRAFYDKTGEDEKEHSIQKEATSYLSGLFDKSLKALGDAILYEDVVGGMKRCMKEQLKKHDEEVVKLNKKLLLFQSVRRKIKNKKKGYVPVLESTVEEQIKHIENEIHSNQGAKEIIELAEKMLEGYKYEYTVKSFY